ncbi:flagellar hook-associated protein FlgL [Oceanotoga teriensis]|jgi:flagellar hook-associated protein 3 FlgL|uniref:Flagellar hook-associated protein 3 FlgL n=1 Tax=Oceanotoga teriensis TaxID=515440 RepID=A0AA45HHS2_9BACT|nr:flagellar hook-associated protein FlgL [Oceanotoga teriensis]MDO7976118.1 flagellar hook-associated protein FlgL [Oceanotoga teriensis]PWJ87279.1 flagellar hook-associated protein 3 FlgL [Oceanotoga teriensis]
MRVTEKYMSSTALADMQKVLQKYTKLNKQMTSGKKVLYPSDNAAIASRVSNLDSRIRQMERYKSSIELAKSYNNMYDQSVQELNNVFLRMKELSVRGSSDSLSQEDRGAIVQELKKMKDHVISIANTKVSGSYIFGGAASDTAPVSPTGEIQTPAISNINQKVSVGGYDVEYGKTVYDVFTTKSGTSAFKLIDRLADAIENEDHDAIQNELGAIEEIQHAALGNLSSIGAVDRLLDLSAKRIEEFKYFNTEFLSKEADADLAETQMNLSMQQVILNNALKTAANILPKSLIDFI